MRARAQAEKAWLAKAAPLALFLAAFASVSGLAASAPGSRRAATRSSAAGAPGADEPDAIDLSLSLDGKDAKALTLEGAVREAIRSASLVLKAQNNVATSGAALLQGYGQYLPTLVAQANYAYGTGTQYYTAGPPTTITGASSGAGYSLTADLNLFNGVSDYAQLKAAILRNDASSLSLFRAKQAIALDVAQGFLAVVLDERTAAIARKSLQESQAREKLLLEQTRVGSKNLSDLFRQQAQTSADESLVLSSENKKRTDQIALLQKLRLDVAKTYHFVEPQLPPEAADRRFEDEASLLQRGLENRGDLKAAGMAASAARWDIRKAKGTYWPQLDLIGSATSGGRYLYSQAVNGQNVVPASQSSLADQLPNQVEYAIGIYLTWNLFDRFLNRQSVAIARASAENAEIDATDAGNRVKAEIRRAYGNYKTALQQLSASKKGEMAAQKAYDVIEGRYEVGSANFIDLITVQATLLQAQVARAQAVIDFMLQGKGLEFAIGETDAE